MVCCYLRSFSWLSPLIAAVVSVSASVFQTKSTNHWVFPDSDIMKGSISLPKVIKVSFWEVWNSPFLSKKIPILQHYLLFDPAHLACEQLPFFHPIFYFAWKYLLPYSHTLVEIHLLFHHQIFHFWFLQMQELLSLMIQWHLLKFPGCRKWIINIVKFF